MKRLLLPALLLLGLTSCTMSKRVSVFVVPPLTPVAEDSIDVAAYGVKYPGYEGVYLYVEKTLEHYGAKEQYMGSWNYAVMDRRKFIVLDPEADWLTSFRLGFKPDTMYIRVTTPDGRVRTYGKQDLKKEKFASGFDFYTLVYPDVVKGTIIEEGWSDASGAGYYPPLDHDIPLQFSIPCERLSFTYACPDWWTLKIKKVAADRLAPAIQDNDFEHKKQIIRYEGQNIPAVKSEPFSPFFKELAQYLQFHITELEMSGAKYERQDSWRKLSKDFTKYALKKSDHNPWAIRDEAVRVAANCPTAYEKLDAIVTYVQNNFDVVYESSGANYPKVIKEKKGEPAELTGLAQSLLEQAGLEAEYLLVHSAEDGYFDPAYYDGEQFEAPAVRVRIDSLDYVVFPYMKHLPVNHVPEYFQGQMALQISKGTEKRDKKEMLDEDDGLLWRTPEGNRAENTTVEDYALTIQSDGAIAVSEHRVARGSRAYSLRETLRELDATETREFIRDLLTYTDGDLTLDSFLVLNLEADKEPLEIDLHYGINNLVVVAPDEILFRTGGLFAPISDLQGDIDAAGRQNPIKISYDQEYYKNITIKYPPEWELTTPPANVSFENDFGLISSNYEYSPGTITAGQKVHLKRIRADKSRASGLAELVGSRSKLEIPTLIFKPGE